MIVITAPYFTAGAVLLNGVAARLLSQKVLIT